LPERRDGRPRVLTTVLAPEPDGVPHLIILGDVGPHEEPVATCATHALEGGLALLGGDVADDDAGAFAREGLGGGAADAARAGPGDQGHLAGQTPRHRVSPMRDVPDHMHAGVDASIPFR
jgi:hypothetical protein